MNAEVRKIRKMKQLDEELTQDSIRLTNEERITLMTKLNKNLSTLYFAKNDFDKEMILDKVVENIYYLLDTFSEMNLYPDYFFRIIFDKNAEFKTVSSNGLSMHQDKRNFNIMYSRVLYGRIRYGLKQDKYNLKNSGVSDINDNFLEMISLFQNFKMPYNMEIEEFREQFDGHFYRIANIMEKYLNADDFIDDMESMMELLFEYLFIIVEIGINPKEKLDSIIDSELNKAKTK